MVDLIDDASTPEDPQSNAPTLTHVPRVLIVEDTLELGTIIQTALKGMDVLTVHETRGNSALNLYHKMRPDIVLLDIGLPDMTGWKLLDAIKESQTGRRRPFIVVITAFSDPANRLTGKLQGVESYLIKPFTLNQVRQIVQRLLDQLAADSASQMASPAG